MIQPTTLRKRARLDAPPAAVHRALTDPAALRTWLAEYAEVDPPARYAFWGRYTPEGDAPRQRLLDAGPATLRFAWPLHGTDTLVDIRIEPEGTGASLLTLSQTGVPGWADLAADTGAPGLMHTFWALAIANLADHVAGRPITGRCDFTSPRLRERLLIDAPPAAVYESLVDPAAVSRWFGAKIDIEPYPGGRFAMGGLDAGPAARILDLDPGRSMSIDWGPPFGVTTWELDGSAGRTRLTVVQSGFATDQPPYGGWLGWLAGLAELRRYHEVPHWRTVWREVHLDGLPDGLIALD